MKQPCAQHQRLGSQSLESLLDTAADIWTQGWRQPFPRSLFLGLCSNVVLAPAVLAATGGALSKAQAYWLAGLGLVTLTLSIYLFFVMFAPEKF